MNKYILKATVDSKDLKPLGFELSNLKRIPDIGIDSYYEYKISDDEFIRISWLTGKFDIKVKPENEHIVEKIIQELLDKKYI